jgi:Fe-Mn family superoxide dismutase
LRRDRTGANVGGNFRRSSNMITRRHALKSAAAIAAALAATPIRTLAQAASAEGTFKLPPLGYAYDALEPYFDAKTMEIHHAKHHQAYVTKLNEALKDYPDLQKKSVEDLLKGLDTVPEKIRGAVRNHAGGHYNHSLFWQTLKKDAQPLSPDGGLVKAFGELFTSEDDAKEQFAKTAMGVFGSGWVWIVVDKEKSLKLTTTANQDCPLSKGETPLFGLDLWEHAYYLKYQNKRADYIQAFSNLLNWEFIEARYDKLVA